jgi:hypothetical protein
METCSRCGHTLGIGRFCVNCGHPRGEATSDARADGDDWRTGTAERPATPTGPAGPSPAPPTQIAPAPESPWGPAAPPPAYETPSAARYPMYADEPAPTSTPSTPSTPFVPAAWEPAPSGGRLGQRSVVPWFLVGVAVLLVAVIGIVLLIGSDDDEPTASDLPGTVPSSSETGGGGSEGPTEPSSDPTSETPPAGESDLARSATAIAPATAPPSRDVDGNAVRYEARNMLDGQAFTAWRAPGDLAGQTIAFTFDEEVVLSSVGMINGYAKSDPGYDGYTANRRVLEVEWVFTDGTVVEQTLGDSRELQTVPVDAVTTAVELRIVRVSRPGRGDSGRDFTAISEVTLVGAPA